MGSPVEFTTQDGRRANGAVRRAWHWHGLTEGHDSSVGVGGRQGSSLQCHMVDASREDGQGLDLLKDSRCKVGLIRGGEVSIRAVLHHACRVHCTP
jgi:hypothetical protein